MGTCIACDLSSGARPLPGGLIHETEHWRVEHCIGPLGVGTLIVKPSRHLCHVADLTDEEAAELGPLLQRVAGVVTELCSSDQVYVNLWSHAGAVPVHIHFVVQPVTRQVLDEFGLHGPPLQVAMFERDEATDPDEVADFALQARTKLSSARP